MWERTFGSVNEKCDSIDHLKTALYFATEVSVPWGIDDVDDCCATFYCGVFGKNCDSLFALKVHRIHNAILCFRLLFMRSKGARLP